MNLKKLVAVSAAGVFAMSASVQAGGIAEPLMEPEVIAEETTSSGGFIIPLLLLAIIVAAASSGGGGGGPAPKVGPS